MAVFLSPVGGVAAQFFTATGAVLTGGKLYTYLAGTTTPAIAYTNSGGATAWTNPIVLDAAGRVSGSGEIWLADGVAYKFVLKDSTDVLIATYDNITGINSNFSNFLSNQEIFTATAGQTVFTLANAYVPGANTLSVFVDGVNQYGPGAAYAYLETGVNTVTFVSGLHVGASVKFTTVQSLTSTQATDASLVAYTPAGAGAVTTTVQNKLRQYVSVKDFGAVGDGVTNDQPAIQTALNYAATVYASVFFPRGEYRINSSINVYSTTAIQGEGIDSTVFRYYGTGGTAIELTGTALAPRIKISLSDFSIYDQGTGVNGINMAYCYYSTLNHLRIYGFTVGIAIANCFNNQYNFIVSESNTQDGYNLSSTDANALNFISCQGVNNGRAGFYSEGGRSVLLSGCTWEANTQYGVWIAGQNTTRPLSHTLEGCYIEGNGLFEVYIDSQGSLIPAGVTIRDCYFEFIAGKAVQAIRIIDGYNVLIDGCTFDNQGGSYTYSLFMASAGTKNAIRFGRNFDSSTSGVYSEIYYENQTKMTPRAWGRFTISGAAIASSNSFGIASITYISAGVYEITLQTSFGATDYAVLASAENGASTPMFLCSPGAPISNTVFRIYTGTAINTSADARTVNFSVFI